MQRNYIFTVEHIEWLKRVYTTQTQGETLEQFNARFGMNITTAQLRSCQKRYLNGLCAKRRRGSLTYTEREEAFLFAALPLMPRKEVQDMFEREFGRRPKHHALDNFATRHVIHGAPNTGRIESGSVPWNKGKKITPHPNSIRTQFQKGHTRNREYELYATRLDGRNHRNGRRAVLMIKIPGPAPWKSVRKTGAHKNAHWVPMARWLWEKEKGPLPKNHVVLLLDGDAENVVMENLLAVPRGVLAILNHAKHVPPYVDKATNPARIRLAQLKYAAGRRERERKETARKEG